MAEQFIRECINGADQGIWGPYELEQNRINLGLISARLYNNGGVLTLSPGRIGLDPGNTRGIYKNTAAKTISIATITDSNWFKIELSTVGTTPSITVLDFTGENNVESIPAAFSAAYDGEKGGYYETATKRIIGIGWKDSLSALGGILNCYPGSNRYSGIITDSSNIYDYDFKNSELLSTITLSLTANKTLAGIKGKYTLHCDAGANGFVITLPSAVTYPYMEIEVDKTDSYATNKSAVTLKSAQVIDDFTIQDSYYYIWLFEKRQFVNLRSNGTQYHITGGWLDYSTGGLNTNDWTDRHLGDLVITYDTETAAFAIGEKITLASGVTGIIVSLTATVMIIKKATSTGIAVNNEAITGSWGGAALVNGSTKNNDSNIWHNLTCDYTIFDTDLYYYENATMNLSVARKIGWAQWDTNTASVVYGFALWGINTTSFYIQTASGGIVLMAANGGISILDNEDHSYSVQVKKYY